MASESNDIGYVDIYMKKESVAVANAIVPTNNIYIYGGL